MSRKEAATLIFISATIDRIKDYILQKNKLLEITEEEKPQDGVHVMRGELDISLVLEKILESNEFYQCAKNICFVKQDSLMFSDLAIAQYDYLYNC